ncbi:DoxX family protein [Nocardia rhizosphaerihabitans]|uniref:DoxX family protein n=1 Tax=Nocardia rhizosphaerihabitans TaxID=1691570 RepID=UPI00366B2B34
MTVARIVVALLLAALLVYSARAKLSGKPEVVAAYAGVGVEQRRLPLLAAVLFAAAGGLVAGLWWTPLGLAAALGLVVYFVLALIAHAIHRDLGHAGPPAVILGLSVACAVLFA